MFSPVFLFHGFLLDQVTSVDIPALATAEFARGDWLKVASWFPVNIMIKVLPPGAQYRRHDEDETVTLQTSQRWGDPV